MARTVIRQPSFPLAAYGLLPFDTEISKYRDLIVDPGHIIRNRTADSVILQTPLAKYRPGSGESPVQLNIPITSAAMQAVSGSKMGIGLARMGGLACIFASQPIEQEAFEIKTVKRHKGSFIEPEVVASDQSITYVHERMERTGYSKFFVTEKGDQHGKLLGVITTNDFDYKNHQNLQVKDRMLAADQLDILYEHEIGYDIQQANERVKESHHSALPVVYQDGRLRDVLFKRDIREHREYKNEMIDTKKRLMVAAAVNTQDYSERVPALIDAGVDMLMIDTSQGWSDYVKDTCRFIRKEFPDIHVIGGNVVNEDGFRFLVEECDVHGVKVGMGIGSICITPEQIGVAAGQDVAIESVVRARDEHFRKTGEYVPIGADGGIRTPRDMLVALAFGADWVMLGRYLAGTEESPTKILYNYDPPKKPYWGEGSARAKAWRENANRDYTQGFDEGIPGVVAFMGPLEPYITKTLMQLREGIRKAGCGSIQDLHEHAVIKMIAEEDVAATVERPRQL